jgi:hypothetical protein
MKPSQVYLLFITLVLAGYGWIGFHLIKPEHNVQERTIIGTCLFKSATGISCPACGTTRSVVHLAHGHVLQAAGLNPFGFVAAFFLILIPGWLIYDLISKRRTLFRAYVRTEETLKTKAWLYIPMIAIVLVNWFWNISKNN